MKSFDPGTICVALATATPPPAPDGEGDDATFCADREQFRANKQTQAVNERIIGNPSNQILGE
jgi:hypothetical protein